MTFTDEDYVDAAKLCVELLEKHREALGVGAGHEIEYQTMKLLLEQSITQRSMDIKIEGQGVYSVAPCVEKLVALEYGIDLSEVTGNLFLGL